MHTSGVNELSKTALGCYCRKDTLRFKNFKYIQSTYNVYRHIKKKHVACHGHIFICQVETIGDAYMVVSGLPKPNDGRHIVEIGTMALDLMEYVTSADKCCMTNMVEICDMALDLLCQVSRFTIRHRPDETLKLRIGIHSGPCAAGTLSILTRFHCV